MVYPVSGQPQQYAASTAIQPGVANQQREQVKTEDSTKPQGTETARTEASQTRSNNRVEDSRSSQYASDSRSTDSGSVYSSSSRGTQLDITA
ncbi:MAG: hypothetical protein DI626_09930 [Micavibrio aeruginosavorus]|uniref:Uncharacterized protein n=1 Tax=Micavibrio aeruginosavorus TaxID=349221 RepID=A0A2W4ZJU3_9BACT|nr:MAG: hypothetical protein DI626_09930 [Micavibrio aeruginosavorus]